MRYDHVLLTGATGSVGSALLARILEKARPGRVTLICRGRTDREAARRGTSLMGTLRARHPAMDTARVSVVRGDVALPELGLDTGTRKELVKSVDAVIHAAADTRLTQPHDSAQRTNRDGTVEVLRFATECVKLERVLHVSTAYVAGARVGPIREDELDVGQAFLNPYERSKFDAEVEVRARMSDLPITVARPSIVVGDSRDGHALTTSAIFPVLRQVASGRMRTFPGSGATRLDVVPVDYVAEALFVLLHASGAQGGSYHLTAGHEGSVSAHRLFEITIREVGRPDGPPLHFTRRPIPPRGSPTDRLDCYLAYLLHEKSFDDSRFQALAGARIEPCPPAESYLPVVLRAAIPQRPARSGTGRIGTLASQPDTRFAP